MNIFYGRRDAAFFNESKYHNKKIVVDGITFDSRKEAKRYAELKNLEKAGEISGLERQPRFELQPAFTKNGKRYRKVEYVADFRYYDSDGKIIVEDVKGYETEVFKLKKKLFEYRYPELSLVEIK